MKAAVMLFSPKKKLQEVDPPFRTLQIKKSFSSNLKNRPVQRFTGSVLRDLEWFILTEHSHLWKREECSILVSMANFLHCSFRLFFLSSITSQWFCGSSTPSKSSNVSWTSINRTWSRTYKKRNVTMRRNSTWLDFTRKRCNFLIFDDLGVRTKMDWSILNDFRQR